MGCISMDSDVLDIPSEIGVCETDGCSYNNIPFPRGRVCPQCHHPMTGTYIPNTIHEYPSDIVQSGDGKRVPAVAKTQESIRQHITQADGTIHLPPHGWEIFHER